MYTCPTDDIHSIYLDNELPLAYIKEYEIHVNNCYSCKEKLNKLKRTRTYFQKDSQAVTPDHNYIDESYNRLLTKMHYSKNTSFTKKPSFKASGIFVPVAAAAAVFAAVFIPMNLHKTVSAAPQTAEIAEITPIERPQSTPLSSQNVVVNGNLYSDLAQNVSTGSNYSNLKDVDVFRPDFNSDRAYTIQIKIPGLSAQDYRTMEIRLPQNLITGQLH